MKKDFDEVTDDFANALFKQIEKRIDKGNPRTEIMCALSFLSKTIGLVTTKAMKMDEE